ncbi:MAG TPA: hypothetical protein VMS96_12725 [Terriglobales bacterium]|nr:hypothetical protein [Terriglobales bacterium]
MRGWFRPLGWVYLPVRPAGWLVTLLVLAFCIHIFVFVDAHSHSVSDTLYGVFPYVVPALMLWNWVAGKTARA